MRRSRTWPLSSDGDLRGLGQDRGGHRPLSCAEFPADGVDDLVATPDSELTQPGDQVMAGPGALLGPQRVGLADDAYAMIDKNEAWLHNAHISEYSHGNRENHPPVRARKLLLHRREIDKLLSATREKGLSLIPTRMYLKNGRIKCEIAVAKGKKFHDKREAERAKGDEAEAREAIRASKSRQ